MMEACRDRRGGTFIRETRVVLEDVMVAQVVEREGGRVRCGVRGEGKVEQEVGHGRIDMQGIEEGLVRLFPGDVHAVVRQELVVRQRVEHGARGPH
jgi:hypothetical protein